jgi:hypothetical protein
MPNDAYTQQRLANDLAFQGRVRSALAVVAFQVVEEDPATPNHDKRVAYARVTINNLTFTAQSIAPWIVERTNVMGADTTYDFPSGTVVSAATDAALESQLMTDWDFLAGV